MGLNVRVEVHRKFLNKTRSHFRALLTLGSMQNIAENLYICIMLRTMEAESQSKWEDYTDEDVATWDEFTGFYEKYASTLEILPHKKIQQLPAYIAPVEKAFSVRNEIVNSQSIDKSSYEKVTNVDFNFGHFKDFIQIHIFQKSIFYKSPSVHRRNLR